MHQFSKKLRWLTHGEQHLTEVAFNAALWEEHPFIGRTLVKQRSNNYCLSIYNNILQAITIYNSQISKPVVRFINTKVHKCSIGPLFLHVLAAPQLVDCQFCIDWDETRSLLSVLHLF